MKRGDVRMLTCAGCGKRFRWVCKKGSLPKWCSDRCRKRTLYSGVCVDCGGRTYGDRYSAGPIKRCKYCAHAILIQNTKAASRCRRDEIVAMWAEGLSIREIAEELGSKYGSMGSEIGRLRREGEPLPRRHRLSPDGIAAMRENGKRAARHLADERLAT